MTSSNGNRFRVTGPLWGESTGHRWIPLTKASGAELCCFLCAWTNGWDIGDLRRHRAYYNVTVMKFAGSKLGQNPVRNVGTLVIRVIGSNPGIYYGDIIMGAIASQITSLTIVYSTVYSGADQRKHQSSASLAFVRGIHCRPVNSQHKWPVTRKMFPSDDVIMILDISQNSGFRKDLRYIFYPFQCIT